MNPTPPLDIVTVAIALSTWALGAELAQYVGPYSIIFLGALGGATWSASSRENETRWQALRYVIWMVGLALIVTVPLAEMISRWSDVAAHWMFAPVAVVVAARPDWVVRQARRLWEARAPKGDA